eukprot:6174054-Pleurochrysis_carterae.AAC.2
MQRYCLGRAAALMSAQRPGSSDAARPHALPAGASATGCRAKATSPVELASASYNLAKVMYDSQPAMLCPTTPAVRAQQAASRPSEKVS